MAATTSDVDYVSAPKNYADLFEQYYPYVVNLCASLGIDENNKEDVACEVLLRFMERDSLEKFDPDLSFYYRGQMRPARFKSYLSRAVDMYTRGHRDKQNKLARREALIADKNDLESNNILGTDNSNSDTWIHYFNRQGDHADGVLDMMTEEAEAEGIRAILARVPRRSAHDRCDLVALYDAVRTQVLTFGEYDITVLREHFGVSSTAMHTWMWWLKENLASIYGIPVPARRPRRMSRNDT